MLCGSGLLLFGIFKYVQDIIVKRLCVSVSDRRKFIWVAFRSLAWATVSGSSSAAPVSGNLKESFEKPR
jgi:hypothetical protein